MAEATCEKCDGYYVDPRMLPCLHSFCLGCLEKEVETQEARSTLHCPSFKEQVTLPENGVSDLPQELHLANQAEIARISEKVEDADEQCEVCGRVDSTGKATVYCIECEEYLCQSCEGRHGRREMTASHNLVAIGQRLVKTNEASSVSKFYQQRMFCPLHKSYILEVYCKQCKKLICKNCMDFKHRQHQDQCDLVEEVAKQEKEALSACEGDTKGALASLDGAIAKCKETMEQVETRKKAVDAAIKSSIEQVCKALLAQNEKVRSSKIAGLEAQVKDLQSVRDGLDFASSMIAEAQSHSPTQLLSTKKVLADRAAKLQDEFKDSKLLPSQSATFVTNISDPEVIGKIVSLGCVLVGGHPPSSTCNAGYLPRAVVNKPRTVKVVAIDKQGKGLSQGGDEVAAKLVPTGSVGTAVSGNTIDHGDGTYSVTVTPQKAGEHELHVTLANGHVKGSPFKYSVTKPRVTPYTSFTWNAYGTKSGPFDVAVSDDCNLAVAEHGYQTVTLYSVTGQSIHSFGVPGSAGSGDGQFYSPSAVAIKGDLMYVGESGNYRVQKFSISKRSFISKFGSSGQGEGQFSNPWDICIDPEGKVFVSEYSNNRIQVFDKNDHFAYTFPCQQNPFGLAFDLEGRLHVSASSSNCIRVFTPEGTLVTSYGTGTISSPAGIAIDGQGYIAISEYGGSNRLWIFGPDHTLVRTLSGNFSNARGIACDKDGFFWVADYGNSRIMKYVEIERE